MIRCEIFANRSMQDDLVEALEALSKELRYTILPLAYGRGGADYKMGTPTWPESNVVILLWTEEGLAGKIVEALKQVKKTYPDEGLTYFLQKTELVNP